MEQNSRNIRVRPEELAEMTGLGIATIYKGLRNGTIPSVKVGKRYVIPRAAIEKWLESASLPAPVPAAGVHAA